MENDQSGVNKMATGACLAGQIDFLEVTLTTTAM
jgi:hypothetical protein